MRGKDDQGGSRPTSYPGNEIDEAMREGQNAPISGQSAQPPEQVRQDDLLGESSHAQKILSDIQSLRSSLQHLKSGGGSDEAAVDPARYAQQQGVAQTGVQQPGAVVQPGTSAPGARPGAPSQGVIRTGAPQPGVQQEGTPPQVAPGVAGGSSHFESMYRRQMEQQIESVQMEQTQERESARRRAGAKEEREREKARKAALRAEQRRKKAERDEARREERRARAKEIQKKRELRAEVKRKKRLARKSAEMGGGVVDLHDTQISTEIQPVAGYSLRDLLGIIPRKEKKAAETQEELENLQKERDEIKEDARQAASHLRQVRANRFQNSALGQRMQSFKDYCEAHKKLLLSLVGVLLLVAVGLAGAFNYGTAFEYSYNGQPLGYVKNKEDVLRITDLVQNALTEDKNIQVVIDAKDDISFKRVSILDKDIVPDTSDQVLRRLTYMGDLNVKAYGIYVNGKKAGAVRSKNDAAETLKEIEDRYASGKDGAKIEKAEILETVDVKESNTDLRNVSSSDEMADILCTSGWKETVHTIVAGETMNDIAQVYGTTEEKIQEDNPGADPRQLVPGNTLLIKQTAPILTVRITEQRTYDKIVKFDTEEKRTDEMYEGDENVEQEGENGKEVITERTVTVNGELEPDGRTILDRKVKKKPVKKIVLVGTAERPPSVGDGKYIWPLAGGYRLSSHFGRRWGRRHAGIDLATPSGNDVMAADGGIVTRAGYFGGYGNCVDIDHQNGQSTRYGHLSSILVSPGDEVYEGQHIAESGNTGRSTGAHLHFEIHINGSPQNPLNYLP